jgi:hypothetical protein
MSFITMIRSACDHLGSGMSAHFNAELPMVYFNRICYGYLHNDWITVISAGIMLIMTVVSAIFVGINHISSNSYGYTANPNNPT